jgi:protein SCO1
VTGSRPGGRGCARLEEALSARIDGEDPGMEDDIIDAHLRRCAGCRAFDAQARAQHPRFRVRTATGVPDLSARILRAVPDGPSPLPRVTIGKRGVSAPMLGAAAVVVVVLLIAGYVVGGHLGGGSSGGNSVAVTQIAGSSQTNPAYPGAAVLPASQVVSKPNIVLTDTGGQPYNVAQATSGRVTLLYFGYTHCPDVCPIDMALAADAVHGLPAAERRDVTTVFITTDPTRDTPAVIKAWLAKFTGAYPGDPTSVGLTASQTAIHLAERQIHMLLSYAAQIDSQTGKYNVVHAGYTLVYSQDGLAHLQVTDTETPSEYTTTLRHLLAKGFVAS